MEIILEHGGQSYIADLSQPISIATALREGDANPNCYYADFPYFETIRSGDFIGSVAEGGAVNHRKLHFSPHGNGTHTECYGHISSDSEATLDKCLQQSHFIAQLISITPEKRENGDSVITWHSVKKRLNTEIPEALAIRSLHNEPLAHMKKWSGTNPPYFDHEVGLKLAKLGVRHLVTDLPSVDRETDGGKLQMHRAFWQIDGDVRKNATITELAAIPPSVADGLYLLDLQAPRMNSDAAPSNPTLYFLKPM